MRNLQKLVEVCLFFDIFVQVIQNNISSVNVKCVPSGKFMPVFAKPHACINNKEPKKELKPDSLQKVFFSHSIYLPDEFYQQKTWKSKKLSRLMF